MNCAVILAAGSGTRMQDAMPKALREVAGRSVLWHVLCTFDSVQLIHKIVLVVPQNQLKDYIEIISGYNIETTIDIIEGKQSRIQSALAGLKVVDKRCDFVAIHDAARVMVTKETIEATLGLAQKTGAAIAVGPIYDTVKQIEKDKITKTLDRSQLRVAHTPQIFKYEQIFKAYEDAIEEGFKGTDSASVMERAGYDVSIYDTNARDIKITVEQDIVLAEAMMSGGIACCGTGYDTHRLEKDRKLILGGVEIPYEKGLMGHSDADVLVHAIMDALLGGAGLRDIGYHFPDTDEQYKDISSIRLLSEVGKKLADNKIKILNIDSTIICEKPKLSPYNDEMRMNIADALSVNSSKINIKATTTEEIGEHGAGRAISALAVCALSKQQ